MNIIFEYSFEDYLLSEYYFEYSFKVLFIKEYYFEYSYEGLITNNCFVKNIL